ncbi:hypothetical protein KO63_24215, partial [Salmonella enterica]|nr:hypothetical protein [Salmonella enterica]
DRPANDDEVIFFSNSVFTGRLFSLAVFSCPESLYCNDGQTPPRNQRSGGIWYAVLESNQ